MTETKTRETTDTRSRKQTLVDLVFEALDATPVKEGQQRIAADAMWTRSAVMDNLHICALCFYPEETTHFCNINNDDVKAGKFFCRDVLYCLRRRHRGNHPTRRRPVGGTRPLMGPSRADP